MVIILVTTATLLLLPLKTTNAFSGEAIYPCLQTPDYPSVSAGDQVRFDHLTSEDGFSTDRVVTMLQDNQGFMWFGTFDGLNRYDGSEILAYRRDADIEIGTQ